MELTWLDSNSWLINIANKQILIDPWLVGDLVFGNLSWLFRGKKKTMRPIPEKIDLIVLSQGLEDHAHPPTLKQLDHNIPVVASPNATKVVEELGFTNIKKLPHGATFRLDNLIEIKAFPGSPIGLQLVENAYVIRDLSNNKSIYYEPHGYHSPALKQVDHIDVIITPLIDLTIPLLGSVIKGQKSALEVCKWLKPQFILPTAAGGDISFEGLLMSVLREQGSIDDFNLLLKENQINTKIITSKSGEQFTLNL